MTQLEINQEINENNRLIESLMQPNIFTLNNSVATLLKRNQELQGLCEHHYVDGFCEYCYKAEDANE